MSTHSKKKKLKFQCPNCKSNNLLLVDYCREYSPVTSITSEPGSGPLSYNGQVIFDNEIDDVEESINAVYTMPEHSLQFDREDISYDDDLCDDEYICAKCDCKYHSLEEALEKGALIKKTND